VGRYHLTVRGSDEGEVVPQQGQKPGLNVEADVFTPEERPEVAEPDLGVASYPDDDNPSQGEDTVESESDLSRSEEVDSELGSDASTNGKGKSAPESDVELDGDYVNQEGGSEDPTSENLDEGSPQSDGAEGDVQSSSPEAESDQGVGPKRVRRQPLRMTYDTMRNPTLEPRINCVESRLCHNGAGWW
jgi:hypothetical protein